MPDPKPEQYPKGKKCPPGTNHKPDICDYCALVYMRDERERIQEQAKRA